MKKTAKAKKKKKRLLSVRNYVLVGGKNSLF